MIYQLEIKDPTKTPIAWLPKVDAFKEPRTFDFKPGLNILWGRNGSGKTTLTKLLATIFHCEQGNTPIVTEQSLRTLIGDRLDAVDVEAGVAIKHDGQGVRHFDPSHAPGLMYGMAAFDWDFGDSGIANAMFKGSAGQTTMFRFDQILNQIVQGTVPEVEWKVDKKRLNDIWRARAAIAERFLTKTDKQGQPTVLLDEPERSYDFNTQVGIWRFIRAYSADVQFIVASHSLFALKIPDANYIELSPGYLAGSIKGLDLLAKWSDEKPKKVPVSKTTRPQRSRKS